jgi:hypothetical protein
MGRILANEGVRGVDGRLGLARAVVGVDDVEARLARLGRERITRHERFVYADGQRVVPLKQRAMATLVNDRRVGHGIFAALPRFAAREAHAEGDNQECQATGGAHCHEVRFLEFAGVFDLKWSPDA